MYTIYADGKLLYAPHLFNEGCGVFSPRLTVELNKAGSLEFVIPPDNICYNSINKLKTIVTVYQDSEELFRGRVLHDERDFYKQKKTYCEGELSFLLDSIQRTKYNMFGTYESLFTRVIGNHNSRVEADKQFTVGNITADGDDNSIRIISIENYPTTLDVIQEKFCDVKGGYLVTRGEGDTRYIDWLKDDTKISDQIIEFGVNLLDLTEYITAENIFTVIIPVGGELYDENGNSLGKLGLAFPDYLENDTAISLFGRIEKYVEWSDIVSRDQLVSTATAYLNKNIEMAVTLTVKAVDLALLNVDVKHIHVGDWVRVVSVPHSLDNLFRCTKIVYDLTSPDQNEYTFGFSFTAFTEQQVSDKKAIQSSVVGVKSAADKANQAAEEANLVIAQMPTTYVTNENFNSLVTRVEDLENGGGGGGTSGENGATFTPSVDSAGDLSWTNDKGLDNPETVNIKGPKGDPFVYSDFTPEQLEGLRGPQGIQGIPGEKGADGTMTFEDLTPEQKASLKGDTGSPGANGYTPVKGTDYWTAADKLEMVNDVLAALPSGDGVSY